jgi:hypothetical protein
MSFTSDDVDAIISELGASLEPAQYNAFVEAAHATLGTCSGPGLTYRILRGLQRQYFDAPADDPNRHEPRHFNRRKSTDPPPPLEEDTARGRASARGRWLRGWRG